jgi:hypothetical protein
MKRFLLALAFAITSPAFADTPPPANTAAPIPAATLGPDAKIGTLCWSQTATATGCTYLAANGGNGDQIVADLRGYTSATLYSNQTTATTYTCDAYSSDNGYDADSGVGTDRSTTSLSESQEMIVLSGALSYLWIECAAIGDNSVTITFLATK